jgi:hypothetical protein
MQSYELIQPADANAASLRTARHHREVISTVASNDVNW